MAEKYLNDGLKQRLVGAGVLLILAGLLWPLLFDFEDREDLQAPASDMPAMPLVEKVVVEKPAPTVRDDDEADKALQGRAAQAVADAKAQSQASGDDNDKAASNNQQAFEALIKDTPRPKPVAGKTKYTVEPTARPRLDANGVPVSFVVQVGTFKNWSNADALRQKLIDQGLKAYASPAVESQAGPYRILVGPVLTYEKAESIVADIKGRTSIKDAIIKRFGVNT